MGAIGQWRVMWLVKKVGQTLKDRKKRPVYLSQNSTPIEIEGVLAAAWNFLCLIETEHRIDTGRLPAELQTIPQPATPAWDDFGRTPEGVETRQSV